MRALCAATLPSAQKHVSVYKCVRALACERCASGTAHHLPYASSFLTVTLRHAWTGLLVAVILVCRNATKAEAVAEEVRQAQCSAGHKASVLIEQADLSSIVSVRRCAKRIAARGDALHILVNNAGVFDMTGVAVYARPP